MNKRVATSCQTDVRSPRRSSDLGEGSGDRCACLWRPALDLEAERIVSVVHNGADLRHVPEPDHQLELGRAELPQVLDRLGNPRLDDLGLSDAAELVAQQGLDSSPTVRK